MKKKFLALSLATVMVLSVTACSTKESRSTSDDATSLSSAISSSKDTSTESSETTSDSADATSETSDEDTYQSIFVEYSEKLEEKATVLVDEFNAEAPDKGGDVNALAELCEQKIENLAAVSTEGATKMASVMTKNGDAYSTYDEWVRNLYGEYEEQGQKITDAYMIFASQYTTTVAE